MVEDSVIATPDYHAMMGYMLARLRDTHIALDQSLVELHLPKSARRKTATRAGCLNLVAHSSESILDNCTLATAFGRQDSACRLLLDG